MEPHDFLDEDLRDTAALFVLDSLSVEEARVFRLHLPHCDVCRGEVESLARTSRDLTLLAPSSEPPPGLWNRVVDRIRRADPRTRPDAEPPASTHAPAAATQIWKGWRPSPAFDFTFVGTDDSAFEPTAVEGIVARRLYVDADHDRVTMIVRMSPGTAYPRHVHGAAEECFVIAGELKIGDQTLRAGDYQRAEVGSVHEVQSTDTGCVLFLVSSQHDELI